MTNPKKMRISERYCAAIVACGFLYGVAFAKPPEVNAIFERDVLPILEVHCYECHSDGVAKGGVSFDFDNPASNTTLWLKVLKNVRADIMPPAKESRLTPEEHSRLTNWIKYVALRIDPSAPDPGPAAPHRLNRTEYNRTIQDLLQVEFPVEAEFPTDESGFGFDNNRDMLRVSPLLLEKYISASERIISSLVPQSSRVVRELVAAGRDFRDYDIPPQFDETEEGGRHGRALIGRPLGFTEDLTVSHHFRVAENAKYKLEFNLDVKGSYNLDRKRTQLVIKVDERNVYERELTWHDKGPRTVIYDDTWQRGTHEISFSMCPLPPGDKAFGSPPDEATDDQPLELRIASVKVRGPFEDSFLVEPSSYRKYFSEGPPPADPSERKVYARRILEEFGTRAFRRPIDANTLDRLVAYAHKIEVSDGGTFELGIGRAMMAILASPRFLFRVDYPQNFSGSDKIAPLDEFSLASRLSYFLWSTMPDKRLLALAGQGNLRKNLRSEVDRMMKHPRASAFVESFTGQWLRARDVEFIPINVPIALGLPKGKGPVPEFSSETRKAMRAETEMAFDFILRNDRSVLELIESNYAFLNEELAKLYGIDGVEGKTLHYVRLPKGSARGGVLTQGTVLTVTSEPTRTSPVKRGQFILENILGFGTPPPPPNTPTLQETQVKFKGFTPSPNELLATHRSNPTCRSCHARMDPIGLGFEHFDAMGRWRDDNAGQPIEPGGTLITGEKFQNVQELKHVIINSRRVDYYRCISEKMLTYALGRGLDYYDIESVDQIVKRLEVSNGSISELIVAIVESVPFQMMRTSQQAASEHSIQRNH